MIATITVGSNPDMEWVSSDGSLVYVHNGTDRTVSVINTSTEQVMTTITVGQNNILFPGNLSGNGGVYEAGAMTPDGLKLVVANTNDDTVSIIDTNPLSPTFNTVIATVTVPNGPSLWTTGITPNNQLAYFGAFNNSDVNVLDLATNVVIATISQGVGLVFPPGVAIQPPGGAFAYAPIGSGSNYVTAIDTTAQVNVATITLGIGNGPAYLAFNPLGTRAYVSNINQGLINVIDTGTKSVIATITLNYITSFSLVNGAGTTTYFAAEGAGPFEGILVIDNASNTVTASVNAFPSSPGNDVVFFGLTPDGTHLYMPGPNDGEVAVIDTATNSVTARVTVGTGPSFVVFANATAPSPSGPGAPGSPTGRQEADCFFDQFDLINVIQWTASSGSPTEYKIYRNAALTDLAGTVPASQLKFKDHNRKKGVTYTYYIVAVDSTGGTSTAAVVTVTPKKNPCR